MTSGMSDTLRPMAMSGGRFHRMREHGLAVPLGRRSWGLLLIALVVVALAVWNC